MDSEVELARMNETLRAMQREIHLLRVVLMASLSDAETQRAREMMAKEGASPPHVEERAPPPAQPAPVAPSASAQNHEGFDSGGS